MLRPKKRWGQNFLIDSNVSKKIVSLLGDDSNETILEIGPGEGALTKLINAKSVIAIEIDSELCKKLKDLNNPKLTVINDNVLKFDLSKIRFNKIIGNLPYNISSQIIFKILEEHNWDEAIFMIQKELADRILSKEGSRQYGRISVMIQSMCYVKKEFNVSHNCFFPKPDIQSTIISLKKKKRKDFNFKKLEKIVRMSFSQRRKKLKNTLKVLADHNELKKFSDKRAEMLTTEDFIYISRIAEKID
tara:strand:+ start:2010 stop:2747 length:738 start_codon:yes stop_codon:yes gene_type:complete